MNFPAFYTLLLTIFSIISCTQPERSPNSDIDQFTDLPPPNTLPFNLKDGLAQTIPVTLFNYAIILYIMRDITPNNSIFTTSNMDSLSMEESERINFAARVLTISMMPIIVAFKNLSRPMYYPLMTLLSIIAMYFL